MADTHFKKGDEVRVLGFEGMCKKYPDLLLGNGYMCIKPHYSSISNETYKVYTQETYIIERVVSFDDTNTKQGDSGQYWAKLVGENDRRYIYVEELEMVKAAPEPDPNLSQQHDGPFSPSATDGISQGEIDVTRYNLPIVKMRRYSPALYKILDDRHRKAGVPLYNQNKFYYHKKQRQEHFQIEATSNIDNLILYIKSSNAALVNLTDKQDEMWKKTDRKTVTAQACELKEGVRYITYDRKGTLGMRTTKKKLSQFLNDFGFDSREVMEEYLMNVADPIHVFRGNTDDLKIELDAIYKRHHGGSCQNGGPTGHACGYGSLFKNGYLSIMLLYKDAEKKHYLGRCLSREMYAPDGEQIFYLENPYAINAPFANNTAFFMQRIVMAMKKKGYRACTYTGTYYNTLNASDLTRCGPAMKRPLVGGMFKGIYHHSTRIGFYHNTPGTRTYTATRKDIERHKYMVDQTVGSIYEILGKDEK